MNTLKQLDAVKGTWEISFILDENAEGTVLEIDSDEGVMLSVKKEGTLLTAVINTLWEKETRNFGKNPKFDFTLTAPECGEEVRLCWRGYSFRLYCDGKLIDEEWPMGDPIGNSWIVKAGDALTAFTLSEVGEIAPDPEEEYTEPFHNFVLPGHNTGVGDCMPFARDGRWCLYYLFDRRRHASKKGLGAHQWAQISTTDLKNWTIHPMAVGITDQMEGSICTGSLIQKDGKTYAFYAIRTSDGTPAQLSWAVSDDGVNFVKSDRSFALSEPYEPVSARDPMVFLGEDGLYHMLVTTSLMKTKDGKRLAPYDGCLAHLTSENLTDWKQEEPFIVPGFGDQPECSDYFEWNGWYYLVYSNCATARYRMSKQPFGPWIRPEVDEMDSLDVRVPKTAMLGDRRLSTGFLDRLPRNYAGNAITHELFQREDGTLGAKHVEEILPDATSIECESSIKLEVKEGRVAHTLPEAGKGIRLKACLKPEKKNMLFGICVEVENRTYRIEMNPAARTVVIVRPGENFFYGSGRDLLSCADLENGTAVDMIIRGDILDMTLCDGRVMTMRLTHDGDKGVKASIFTIDGDLDVSNIEVMTF